MRDQEIHLSFWNHIEELRKIFIKCLCIIAAGITLCLIFFPAIFGAFHQSLMKSPPVKEALISEKLERIRITNTSPSQTLYLLPQQASQVTTSSKAVQLTAPSTYLIPGGEHLEYTQIQPAPKLIVLSPTEGLAATLTTSFWIGLAATSPLWLFYILQFIAPALNGAERKLIYPFMVSSFLAMGAGFGFGFYITLPLANMYLSQLNETLAQNLWSLSQYVHYTIVLVFANAIAFETSVVLFFLVHYGILKSETMKQHRRGAIVAIFILSALLTPPDVLTQLLLAIPLMAMYEGAILYAHFRQKKWSANPAIIRD